jgi:hypothetical protein
MRGTTVARRRGSIRSCATPHIIDSSLTKTPPSYKDVEDHQHLEVIEIK